MLNWPGSLQTTDTYQQQQDRKDYQDLRGNLSPKNTPLPYWFRPEKYPQVFMERHGFLPDLSALDLLFCCGKSAGSVLKSSFYDTNTETQSPF